MNILNKERIGNKKTVDNTRKELTGDILEKFEKAILETNNDWEKSILEKYWIYIWEGSKLFINIWKWQRIEIEFTDIEFSIFKDAIVSYDRGEDSLLDRRFMAQEISGSQYQDINIILQRHIWSINNKLSDAWINFFSIDLTPKNIGSKYVLYTPHKKYKKGDYSFDIISNTQTLFFNGEEISLEDKEIFSTIQNFLKTGPIAARVEDITWLDIRVHNVFFEKHKLPFFISPEGIIKLIDIEKTRDLFDINNFL